MVSIRASEPAKPNQVYQAKQSNQAKQPKQASNQAKQNKQATKQSKASRARNIANCAFIVRRMRRRNPGTKSFKIAQNQIYISLEYKYIFYRKNLVRVKSFMGFKIWWSWGVGKPISKSKWVAVFSEIHAQLQKKVCYRVFCFQIWFKVNQNRKHAYEPASQAKPSLANSS